MPNEASLHHALGLSLVRQQQLPRALKEIERATVRWPADRDLLLALATMQRDASRRDAARAAVQCLLAANPGDRDARTLAAELQ